MKDFIIIDNRILVSTEEWGRIKKHLQNIVFSRNYYCESSGVKCDQQCKYCRDEK